MDLSIRAVFCASLLSAALSLSASNAAQKSPGDAPDTKVAIVPEPSESPRYIKDEHEATSGSVTIGGRAMSYQAEAGILVVHVTDPMDADPPLPHEDRNGP